LKAPESNRLQDRIVSHKKYIFLIPLFIVAFPIAAQHFKPYSILRVLQTEHFELIYSARSEATARKLATRADALYEEASALTGITLARRVPVVITPETDQHNGYMNPMPYPHIVIFDTPASIEWTVFSNSLEALFFHEMTHAVTGSTRSGVEEFFYRIFGGWVYPSGLTAPWFMIEGAAVSFESLDGTGRANDPLIKQKLRQDILENSFKTPFQAEGVWDLPPLGNTYYYYGGLFSSYLQKEYGMEKYGELWREMGRDFHLSIIHYNSGFYAIFRKVYGVSIIDCWNDFRESLSLDGVEENKSAAIYGERSIIKDTAAAGGKIFFIDNLATKVLAYDTESGKTNTAVFVDGTAYALDVSADGKRILVSSYQRLGAVSGQFSRAIVVEYNASNGFRTGREWRGLYNARYFRDGVVALNSDTHLSNLVYRPGGDRKGKQEEVLLRGSETLLFSNPSPLDDDWIAFTSAKSGVRELSLFNYRTGALYSLSGNLETDGEVWRYMRGLRFSGGRLYFSYNDDDRMYKLASISVNGLHDGDGESAEDAAVIQAHFSKTDFSGGVFYPVSAGGSIYYGASFSVWDRIMKFPQSVQEFETVSAAALKMIRWQDSPAITEETYNKVDAEQLPPAKLYNPVKYFNPFNLWIPFPLVSPVINSILWDGTDAFSVKGNFKNLSLDGAGLFSFISDPMDQNLIFLSPAYDFRNDIVPVNITWMNFSLMFPITASFTDVVDVSYVDVNMPIRKTSAQIQGQYRISLGNGRLSLTVVGMFNKVWYSFDLYNSSGAENSAYNWPLQQEASSVTGGLHFSNLILSSWERFGNGFIEQFYARKFLPDYYHLPRFENMLKLSVESPYILHNIPVIKNFAFQGVAYGVYDKDGVNHTGHSSLYYSSIFDKFTVYEYTRPPYVYPYLWLLGGEFKLSPVSVEIQKNLSHLYFNRVYASVGYHWVYLGEERLLYQNTDWDGDSRLLHSLTFSVNSQVSIVPITVLPLKITFSLTGALKLSTSNRDDYVNPLYLGWGLSVSY
jgi:hypothetical protein